MQARAIAPAWKLDRQTRDPDQRSGRGGKKRDDTMTLSKILATSAVVGLMGSAAFANEINFSQSGGSVNAVTFTQTTGTSNMISSNDTTSAATVTGSLDTLKIEQIGSTNAASFAITTDTTSAGDVAIQMKGAGNTSALSVTQGSGNTLAFSVGVKGDNNSVAATINADASVVNLESQGDDIAFGISQTGDVALTSYDQSIIANVKKTGSGVATVDLIQSGASNSIILGTPSAYGAFIGTGGLTLAGAATVSITQSAALASYQTTQTVPAGGSLTVVQSN
jgi:hypothetical protein